jgi:hypothetical protein
MINHLLKFYKYIFQPKNFHVFKQSFHFGQCPKIQSSLCHLHR